MASHFSRGIWTKLLNLCVKYFYCAFPFSYQIRSIMNAKSFLFQLLFGFSMSLFVLPCCYFKSSILRFLFVQVKIDRPKWCVNTKKRQSDQNFGILTILLKIIDIIYAYFECIVLKGSFSSTHSSLLLYFWANLLNLLMAWLCLISFCRNKTGMCHA